MHFSYVRASPDHRNPINLNPIDDLMPWQSIEMGRDQGDIMTPPCELPPEISGNDPASTTYGGEFVIDQQYSQLPIIDFYTAIYLHYLHI